MSNENTKQVIVVTGASSGIGALTVRALARAGHIVYAGIRDTAGKHAALVADICSKAPQHGVDLRPIELDVLSQTSVDGAIAQIIDEQGRLDTVIHNAGHMVLGPVEAFTPEQLAEVYDTNVLGTQRVNRAALPHLRRQRSGLLLWIGSSSTRGGCPPFLAPYFAAKAAGDALAVSYAAELIRFGIDTCIVVPGVFTSGTNHFAHAGHPADQAREADYEPLYGTLRKEINERLARLVPADADVTEVATEIVRLVGLPPGSRPLRSHVDPSRDGSEVVSAVADRIRVEFYRRIGIEDLLPINAAL